jgi:hypothetical protein
MVQKVDNFFYPGVSNSKMYVREDYCFEMGLHKKGFANIAGSCKQNVDLLLRSHEEILNRM